MNTILRAARLLMTARLPTTGVTLLRGSGSRRKCAGGALRTCAKALVLGAAALCAWPTSPAQAAGGHLKPLRPCFEALDAWQLEDAIACAAHALMQNPNSFEARALAAEVMHQRGQHQEALALLGQASSLAPSTRLAQFLPQLQGSAAQAATFETLITRHFRIRFQNKDVLMAHYAQDVLEAAYTRIGADLDARPSEGDEPITVEIYPTLKSLAQATGLTEQEIETSGTIAVCKFHRLMVISALATSTGYAWADTLAHELTHLMVSKRSHNTVPIWLHEGIAKYYETRWRGAAGLSLTAHSEGLLSRAAETGAFISFARMHPSMAKLPNPHDAALAFAEVFAMVQMLVQQRGPHVIATALRSLGEGVPFDTVLAETLGGDIKTLERRLHRALKKRPKSTAAQEAAPVRLGPMAAPARQAAAVDALSEDAVLKDHAEARALLRLGELLALQGHTAEAIDPWQRAHGAVGTKLPQLGLRLAQALGQTEQFLRAEKIIAATAKAHPDFAPAHKLWAELLVRRKAYAQAVQPAYAACLHNPFDPEVHALWAEASAHLNDAATAARERHFAELAQSPRQVAPPPVAQKGSARLRVVTEPWGSVFIDGSPTALSTPLWDLPVAPGPHTLRAEAQSHGHVLQGEHTFDAQAGTPALWRTRLVPKAQDTR